MTEKSKNRSEYKGEDAPKLKRGMTAKTIKEGQPVPVPLRYAMAAGITPAVGEGNKPVYDKGGPIRQTKRRK